MLEKIGYWNDETMEDFIEPQVLVGQWASKRLKQRVLDYLGAGRVASDHDGHCRCRFKCSTGEQPMRCRDLTDGTWVWPESLVHYVDKHDVVLPDEFIDHAERNGWDIPPPDPEAPIYPCFSATWWLGFCRDRSGANA